MSVAAVSKASAPCILSEKKDNKEGSQEEAVSPIPPPPRYQRLPLTVELAVKQGIAPPNIIADPQERLQAAYAAVLKTPDPDKEIEYEVGSRRYYCPYDEVAFVDFPELPYDIEPTLATIFYESVCESLTNELDDLGDLYLEYEEALHSLFEEAMMILTDEMASTEVQTDVLEQVKNQVDKTLKAENGLYTHLLCFQARLQHIEPITKFFEKVVVDKKNILFPNLFPHILKGGMIFISKEE